MELKIAAFSYTEVWKTTFSKDIAHKKHTNVRSENHYLTPKLYKYTELAQACELGSIILIRTSACDILMYGLPGGPAHMTRINRGEIKTVYNINRPQFIPKDEIKHIYVGKLGKMMLKMTLRYNENCQKIIYLSSDLMTDKYINATFNMYIEKGGIKK